MRLSIFVLSILVALCACASASLAQVVTLHDPVDLRARPGAKRPVVMTAPVGSDLTVMSDGREWVAVDFEGKRFYAPAVQLAAATPASAPGADPTCDYGYPYSGSGQFFARPLAQLRHSGPFGFLLGDHRFYPC